MDLAEQLNHIFNPRTIAIVGASATPDKPGSMCLANLVEAGFTGKIYPVNPDLSELFGSRVYPSIKAIPGKVDLAIIAIPAQLTMSVIEECVAKGIAGVIMFTSGFRELGTEIETDWQDRIRDIANNGGMKIIGPNCQGVANPQAKLNAMFTSGFHSIKAGNVAVASQSGGVCTYIANTLTNNNVGVSKVVSMGNRCNLDFDEIVEYLAQDDETKVIILYIEGLERPRELISVTKQVVRQKPIVVYKVGRKEELNQASLSHTGTLAGKYEFYKAAFTQAGIITANDMTELVDVTKALAFQPPSSGDRVAVISPTAGVGIIMADKCCELGLRLAQFSPATWQRLRQLVSPLNPVDNPVDLAMVITDFDACREILKVVMEDNGVDMVALGSIHPSDTLNFNRAILDVSRYYRKPITSAYIGSLAGEDTTEIAKLEKNNIPTYPFPERAVTALTGLLRYGRILRAAD